MANETNPERNTEMIRIRATPELKAAFEAYCADTEQSDASGGRDAIWRLIRKNHKARTGKDLPKPDVTERSWGNRA